MMTTDSGWDDNPIDIGGDGSFTDISLLGGHERGFCDLYRVRRYGKWHVLKALKPDYRDTPACQAMLRKEFDIGFHLSHPSIAATIGLEQVEGLGLCIIEEWVDGITLDQYIGNGDFDAAKARHLTAQLCEALNYIHARQIIHRDLKPSNILITADGDRVKLIDFGVSDTARHAIFKGPAGTRKYAAPEIVNGGKAADSRSDLYSLGVILDQMNSKLPQSDRRFEKAAEWCMAEDPARRPSSASEVMAVLNAKPSRKHFYLLAAALAALIAIIVWMALPTRSAKEPIKPVAVDSVSDKVEQTLDTTLKVRLPKPETETEKEQMSTPSDEKPKTAQNMAPEGNPSVSSQLPSYSRQVFLAEAVSVGMLSVSDSEEKLRNALELEGKDSFNRQITVNLKKRIEYNLMIRATKAFSDNPSQEKTTPTCLLTDEGQKLMDQGRKIAFEYAQQRLHEFFPEETIPPFPNDKVNWFK